MKLSIIIPIYNVGQYLERCIDSCELQLRNSDDFEILIIDDGSTDNSGDIIRKLQKRYRNIQYYKQENGGQASARNRGVLLAKGDYIWFVDGDDYLTPDGIEDLLDEAINLQLDVHAFNFQFVFEDQTIKLHNSSAPSNKCSFEHGRDLVCNVDLPHTPWIGLLRRHYIINNNLKFNTEILYEDFELMPRVYCMAEKCQFTNEVHYNYFQREGSTMKSYSIERNKKRCRDLLRIADSLYVFATNNLTKGTLAYTFLMRQVSFSITQSLAYYSKEVMPLSEYRNKPYFPMDTSILAGSMKLKAMLANFSLHLYLLIYKIIK